MAAGGPAGPGLLGTLRRVLAESAELLQVRLALFGTELEREKLRVVDALTRAAVALLLVGLGGMLLVAFVIVLAGDQYRLLAIGLMTLVFLGGGVWMWFSAVERLKAPGGLFATTVAELAKDRAALGGGSRPPAPPPNEPSTPMSTPPEP